MRTIERYVVFVYGKAWTSHPSRRVAEAIAERMAGAEVERFSCTREEWKDLWCGERDLVLESMKSEPEDKNDYGMLEW